MTDNLKFTSGALLTKTIEELNMLDGFTIQRFGATGNAPLDQQIEDCEISLKRYVGVYPSQIDNLDLSEAADMTEEELKLARLEDSMKANQFLKEANKYMDAVAKFMANVRVYDALLKRMAIQPLEHSHNQWQYDQESFLTTEKGSISNAVYQFTYRHCEETGYGWRNNGATAWYLTWFMYIRSANPDKNPIRLAGQDRKRFTNKDEMIAYLAGRQKKFENCFQEDFPPVPKKYKQLFSYAGMMLPGYHVEEETKDGQ
jgi:hypothetical protein